MSHRRAGFTIVCVLLAFLLSTASDSGADEASEERAALQRVRVSHLAAMGRCRDALEVTEAASSLDATTELLVGRCAIEAKQYARGLSSLERAREQDPALVGVDLYRAIALYHLNDFGAARSALSEARVSSEDVALVEFYDGLLLLREDKPRESALAFERAAARSPERVEPVASYYAALAWQSLNENEPLDRAVDRVRKEEPGGPWAGEVDKLVAFQAERRRGGQTGLQRWLNLRAGQEYDSNVVLRGVGVPLPEEISSEHDWLNSWSAVAGAELIEVEHWTLGTMLSYAGNAHDDLDEFDQHYLVATLWADREIRATTLGRLRLDAGAGWVDGDSYLFHVDLEVSGEERWGRMGTSRCNLATQLDDFRYDAEITSQEQYGDIVDQDGVGLRVGCGHELPLAVAPVLESDLYGGYEFSSYFANGSEWDHVAHALHLGFRMRGFFDIELDARGSYTRRDFRKPSYFAVEEEGEQSRVGSDRNDDAWQADVELSREMNDFVKLVARYQYVDNGSSAAAFDYQRHFTGVYVEFGFH